MPWLPGGLSQCTAYTRARRVQGTYLGQLRVGVCPPVHLAVVPQLRNHPHLHKAGVGGGGRAASVRGGGRRGRGGARASAQDTPPSPDKSVPAARLSLPHRRVGAGGGVWGGGVTPQPRDSGKEGSTGQYCTACSSASATTRPRGAVLPLQACDSACRRRPTPAAWPSLARAEGTNDAGCGGNTCHV